VILRSSTCHRDIGWIHREGNFCDSRGIPSLNYIGSFNRFTMFLSPLRVFVLPPEKQNVDSVLISGDRREKARTRESVTELFSICCIDTSVNRTNRRSIGEGHHWNSLNVSSRPRKRQWELFLVQLIIAVLLSEDCLVPDARHDVQIADFCFPEFPTLLIRIFLDIRSLIAVTCRKRFSKEHRTSHWTRCWSIMQSDRDRDNQ
jgi:hypothetical protein